MQREGERGKHRVKKKIVHDKTIYVLLKHRKLPTERRGVDIKMNKRLVCILPEYLLPKYVSEKRDFPIT